MSSIYTVGGTVEGETRAYVERTADRELLRLCLDGELGYLLTSRQMGKSSMMVHTARRLNERSVRTVSISLEQIGTSGVTPEQWYLGLLEEIEEQLNLDTETLAFWEGHAHLSYPQRFSNYLEQVVLSETEYRVVVFIDEIDTTLSLGFSTDDFFAAIRRLYNLRVERPALKRLSFVLIGVATPDDLIADPNRTPFNIGRRVDLSDFEPDEATPLAAGLPDLGPDRDPDRVLAMARVFHWTDGHPFLTQRLCAALAEDHDAHYRGEGPEPWIDRTAHRLFFDEQAAKDSNLDFVKNMLTQRIPRGVRPVEIPLTYQRILEGHSPEPDEERSTVKNHLKLSGVVKRQGPNLVVRNRIYRKTFDKDWVKQQLPTGELARQLWRKLTTTLAPVAILASVLLTLLTVFAFYQANQAGEARQIAREAQNAARIEHLSTSGLLAAYSPSPYAGDQRRASLLVRQAWNLTRTEQLPDSRVESLRWQATSNLLRANQVIGHLRATLQGHSAGVRSVAVSPDWARVVSGSWDKTLRLWDAATGKPIGEPWRGHNDSVWSVAFSPDGRRVVSGSEDNSLRLWDAATGQPIGEPWQGYSDAVLSVDFSPDGGRVVSGSWDKTLRLWDAATGQPIGKPWQGHSDSVWSVAFSPDGRRVVSGSRDNSLRLWDVATGKPIGEPWQIHSASVYSVTFSPDGKQVVSGSGDHTLRLWDAATGQPIGEPWQGHSASVESVAFNPDGRRMVSGSFDKTLRLWDAATGRPIGEPPARSWLGHRDSVWSVDFSPDGRRVISGSQDKTLRLWDAATGQPIGEPWQGHSANMESVDFSPDGARVVSGSRDNTLRLWDAATGQPIGEPWQGHSDLVSSVAFSPDGGRVVSGSGDNSLRLWDAAAGRPIGKPWQGHSASVWSVAFSPDGRRVVSGSGDHTLLLWDAATGQPIGKPWQGHSAWVWSVAFSPDGGRVVSGSGDRTLRLWDAATGQPIGAPWQSHSDSVWSVAFSPDGRGWSRAVGITPCGCGTPPPASPSAHPGGATAVRCTASLSAPTVGAWCPGAPITRTTGGTTCC